MTIVIARLKRRADFLAVASEKRRFALRDMVIQYKHNAELSVPDTARVGFTVTKKQGNAVIRNRIRRRLKAATQQLLPELARPHYDYVFIARSAYAICPFEKILEDIRFAFQHIHRPKKPQVTS
jgi:ribonuclease P protein component